MSGREIGDGEVRERENPFSSRFVRPGAMPFLFSDGGESAALLVDRFLSAGRRGQIVGPHGTGKSTLLATLIQELAARGEHVQLIELHDGQRRLPSDVAWKPRTIVCIDGYEQLSYVSRARVAWRVRRSECGLLITTHAPVGFPVRLPTLFKTQATLDLAMQLAAQLLAHPSGAGTAGDISRAEIENHFSRVGGDMRELFFQLYDLAESRRS